MTTRPGDEGDAGNLLAENEHLRLEVARLTEENLRLRRALYGTKSEQMENVSPEESTSGTPEKGEDGSKEDAVCNAGKEQSERPGNNDDQAQQKPGRRRAPAHLPRESQVFELSGDDLKCSCGCMLAEFDEEVSEQIGIEPVRYKVIERRKKKYKCCGCGKTIKTARAPKSILPGATYGSPEFCAHVVTAKCQHSLPLYRLESMLNEEGIPVDRTTLSRMMMSLGEACEPLWLLLGEELRDQDIAHVDETTFQVLREPDRRAETVSWIWQYCSAFGASRHVVLFDYQMTRSGEHPRRFFSEAEGASAQEKKMRYIHVDGYAGYNNLKDRIRVGCWAHVRRKFFEALKAIPETSRTGTIAEEVLHLINTLYAIEKRIKKLPFDEKRVIREREAEPLIESIREILDMEKDAVVRGSLIGKAVNYALGQWCSLTVYTHDGRLSIDNNISEREIKSVVMGRKNWLFADSQRGAKSLAIMYSLVRTAVANDIRPYLYLKHIFTELPKMKRADEVRSLLPWNLPEDFPRIR